MVILCVSTLLNIGISDFGKKNEIKTYPWVQDPKRFKNNFPEGFGSCAWNVPKIR